MLLFQQNLFKIGRDHEDVCVKIRTNKKQRILRLRSTRQYEAKLSGMKKEAIDHVKNLQRQFKLNPEAAENRFLTKQTHWQKQLAETKQELTKSKKVMFRMPKQRSPTQNQ